MKTYHTLELVRVILDHNDAHQFMGFRLAPSRDDWKVAEVLTISGVKEHPANTVLLVDQSEIVERWPFQSTITI